MTVVMSEDGTLINYPRSRTGPAVILVGGGLDDGSENAALATALPQAERRIIAGQSHVADRKVLAEVLEQFFTG